MNLTITKLNGEVFDLAELGVKTLDFQIDAPSLRLETEEIDGRHGVIELNPTYGARMMRASFYFAAASFVDSRSALFKLFDSLAPFYLSDSREPHKRWLVRVTSGSGFSIEQLTAKKGRFDVEFVSASPYAESVDTTLAPTVVHQAAPGLTSVDLQYRHNTATFRIYNASDVAIDPRALPLTVLFSGASTNLSIANATTGDTWQYTGATIASDIVELNGVRSLKNGVSIFANTNRKLLTLAPGINEFIVTGATDPFEISFDFRFYYL